MCGIVGVLESGRTGSYLKAVITSMAEVLRHRGPDDQGTWVDEKAGVGVGHCRLTVLDQTPEGRQPMVSESGRYRIVHNGEIYNFQSLRSELHSHGYCFRSRSDTEVILAALEKWGIDDALPRLNGMFAFAIWDNVEKTLYLARDRMGEKPLYYGRFDSVFLFGSELKSLRAHPSFIGNIDRNAVGLYMRFGYVPSPLSIYRNIFKLPPGTILRIPPHRIPESDTPYPYWSIGGIVENAVHCPFRGSDIDAVEQLEELVRDSVRMRMIADVPLGACLSGGIDSSAVVALMRMYSTQPVKTFTIGFAEDGYNEADSAKAVAGHLGTDHYELYVTPNDAMKIIPRLPELYDEPFSDVSQIPARLLSEMVRRHVTVALTGDGGDELFFGYTRYRTAFDMWKIMKLVPYRLRNTFARILSIIPLRMAESLLPWTAHFFNSHGMPGPIGDKLRKAAVLLSTESPKTLYHALLSHWQDPAVLVTGTEEPAREDERLITVSYQAYSSYMMALDAMGYLPDDIMVKMDRASMSVGLECRAPLLDHRLVEYAFQLPISLKYRNGRGKWILRELLRRYVPLRLIDRPKAGFAVPISSWLRGPLRDWADELLDETRLRNGGILDPRAVRRKWEEHQSGARNWHYLLWDVIVFQRWIERWA